MTNKIEGLHGSFFRVIQINKTQQLEGNIRILPVAAAVRQLL